MAEIVNLRTARKRKAREDEAVKAEQNRILFGRTKAEKNQSKAEAELAARRLEGHKLED
ncbi:MULTISPECIES: DUF4169 family protein [unclassified Devosia]|uniref:DUF4169 family protein n=1 Tax=unclassified Devosia TaxID=196773 RepID=UPI000FD87D69|nr:MULTISPECIES: DUF4169 family protein [unclassified Devosia]